MGPGVGVSVGTNVAVDVAVVVETKRVETQANLGLEVQEITRAFAVITAARMPSVKAKVPMPVWAAYTGSQ